MHESKEVEFKESYILTLCTAQETLINSLFLGAKVHNKISLTTKDYLAAIFCFFWLFIYF